MYKRLFLLTLVFSLYMASLGFGQTPAGESTISISEPSISASTGEVVKYEICGMISHQHTGTCESTYSYHPVTSEWKPDSSVYIQIKTQASGYGLAKAILSKVIIDGEDKIGGSAGSEPSLDSKYVGDCGVISTLWSTHAQAYKGTMTVYRRHYEPAGTVGSTHEWTADGWVEAYSVEWSRSGGRSVGLEVSAEISKKDPNFTTTLTGGTHKGISSSYAGTATIAKPYPGAGAGSTWKVSRGAKCGNDLCTSYDDMTGPHDHHAICGGCGIHIKCKRRPGIHVLHATCPKPHCDALNVWECSHTCGSGSGSSGGSNPPSDGTPNCPDCTSDCSSPCSCSNSGTCGGTVTDNTPDCSYCTDGCSSCDSTTDETPNCPDCTSHCSSPCSCSNSGTCNGSAASPSPPPTPPSTLVPCSACGGSYDTSLGSSFVEWHTVVKTCKYCGAEFRRCSNRYGSCPIDGYHTESD